MSLLVYAVGIHKIFNKTGFPQVTSLKDDTKANSTIFLTADSEDAAIFGEQYKEGNQYEWSNGQLFGNQNSDNTAIITIDLATNASKYDYPYGGGTDCYIQNGFCAIPLTNMDKWYNSDHKRVVLNILPDALVNAFGERMGSQEGLSILTTLGVLVNDDDKGPSYIFSYNVKLDYTEIDGYITIGQWEDSNKLLYDFTFNPRKVDPIRITSTEQEDGSYATHVIQDAAYCAKYIQEGHTTIELTIISVDGDKSYSLLRGTTQTANYVDADNMFDVRSIICSIPSLNGEDFSDMILIVNAAAGSAMIKRSANQINDVIKSTTKTWSSKKISDTLIGVYKYVGSVYDYDTLPSGDQFETLNKVPDIPDDSAIFVSISPIWQNVSAKQIKGIKLSFTPGNTNTKLVWFRNSENWSRNTDTNIKINGQTLADLGYSVDITEFGPGVTEATITLNTFVTITGDSTINMDALTWGSETIDGVKHNNEYIVNKIITFSFLALDKGNVYNTIKTGMNYAWTGTEWDALGPIMSGDSIMVGGTGQYADNTIEEAINAIDEKTTEGNIVLFDFDVIAEIVDTSTGVYGETIYDGETETAELFYNFIGEDPTSTITLDEYFQKLIKSCVYLSTGGAEKNLKMTIATMQNDGANIILSMHNHMYDSDTFTYDAIFILNFANKVASILMVEWKGDEMHAALPIMVLIAIDTYEEDGITYTKYQLKNDGEDITSKNVYDYEVAGKRILYYSIQLDGETKRIIAVNRAEGSSIENCLSLYYVETSSHTATYYTPSITYFNFSTNGKIIYNETADKFIEGRVEDIKLLRDIVNEDKYLGISTTNRSVYTISANTIELDKVIEANTVPAYANIITVVGTAETTYENAFCLGASTSFHGGKDYYYFATENSGSFIVKTEDIKDGNALKTNQEVQTYEWDTTNKVMNPITGQKLYVSSFTYAPASVGLADALDVKRHLDNKLDIIVAGDGIDISTNTISIHSDNPYIKYYATLEEYNSDTTRSEDVCVSYILDIDKVLFEHVGYDPEN